MKYPFKGATQMTLGYAIEKGRREEPTPVMMSKYTPELKTILSSLLENV
jgi:hypothetical protein